METKIIMKTKEEITELAHKRYGFDPFKFGGQRDGFIEGYTMCQESTQQIDNLGWTKIESEADLPKESGKYHVVFDSGVMDIEDFENTIYFRNKWSRITHYQPVQKPLPPLR